MLSAVALDSFHHTVRFAGQVAVVTGAARRIGRSIALALAREGADVLVHYRRSQAEAEQLAGEITKLGRAADTCAADLTRKPEIDSLFARAQQRFGRLHMLINNAGMFEAAPVDALSETQWDTMLDTNLKAQFFCAQAAAPLLRQSGRGRIVNLASLGGLLAWPKYTHYCVSKAGVIMLTRCLARALAPAITVNCVAPGTISFPGEMPDAEYIRRAPLARTGKADDIAEAVIYLLSAEFVTGQVLVVDGGRSLA